MGMLSISIVCSLRFNPNIRKTKTIEKQKTHCPQPRQQFINDNGGRSTRLFSPVLEPNSKAAYAKMSCTHRIDKHMQHDMQDGWFLMCLFNSPLTNRAHAAFRVGSCRRETQKHLRL